MLCLYVTLWNKKVSLRSQAREGPPDRGCLHIYIYIYIYIYTIQTTSREIMRLRGFESFSTYEFDLLCMIALNMAPLNMAPFCTERTNVRLEGCSVLFFSVIFILKYIIYIFYFLIFIFNINISRKFKNIKNNSKLRFFKSEVGL